MRSEYLVLGAAVFSSIAHTATIPTLSTSHSKTSVVHSLPELAEDSGSWSEHLRGLSDRFLGRHGRHGQREHEQKHVGVATSQRSRYAEDIVLRFNLSTQAEGMALVEASQVLFLDVWSSTREHVDIRLSERDVSLLLSCIIGDNSHRYSGSITSWAPA